MANMSTEMELPIIPEDLANSEEELDLDLLELYLQWVYRCIQDGIAPADWSIADPEFPPVPK